MQTFQLPPRLRKQLLISIGFSMLIGVLSAIYFVLAQPMLPLFYSLALSSSQLVPKMYLFTLSAISVVVSVLHAIILYAIQKYDRVIQTLFSWSTLIVQLLLLISLVRIIGITM